MRGTNVINAGRLAGYKGLRGSSLAFKSIASSLDRIAYQVSDSYAVHRLPSEDRKLLERNGIYRDIHRGKRCFVMGTGPSLATQDITPLGSEITLVMSGFWMHPAVKQWQPTYYCLADPYFFKGAPGTKEYMISMYREVPGSTFFLPIEAYELNKNERLLPPDQTRYVLFNRALADDRIATVDFSKVLPGVQSVSQMSILLALYMGCSPIYLLGLDHDWLSHQGQDKHFYKGYGGLDKNKQLRTDLTKYSYRVLMEDQLKLWKGYEHLKMYASDRGVKIINATNGGFLDVFERADYDTIIKA